MQADSLRSLDIGGLYRPGLILGPGGVGPLPVGGLYPFGLYGCGYPIAAGCCNMWNMGCFNRCYNPCGPWAGAWAGVGAPGPVGTGFVAPGYGVPSGCATCGGVPGPYIEGC